MSEDGEIWFKGHLQISQQYACFRTHKDETNDVKVRAGY